MVFQNAPDTEAPVEINTYFPQFKALWTSEIITGTVHNIYTMAQGKYLHATEILNRLVFAEPRNQAARRLLADA